MIGLLAEAGTYIFVWFSGAGTALAVRALLRHPRTEDRPVEGIDGLDKALDAARRDLPTAVLPNAHRGTVYTSRDRRKGSRWRLAYLGRPHARRAHRPHRHLP